MPSTSTSQSLNALPPGTVLRDYVIESELGSGGFSIVYLARHHLNPDWLYAIKEFLPGELAVRARDGTTVHPVNTEAEEAFDDGLRRFRDEAEQLRKFRNEPYIVSCLNYFEQNGTAYLVMDHDDGLPLLELLRQREAAGQPFTEKDLLAVVEPLLDGLTAVHRAGVLHRDIKPGNIFVRRQDDITGRPAHPVLIDFGAAKQNYLARHSRSRAPYTPGYAAYEQVSSMGEIGPWTDVYALGALMWRMVAGGCPDDSRLHVPDGADDADGAEVWSPTPREVEKRAYAMNRGRADPMPSAVALGDGRFSRRLLEAIDKCLALYPEDRIQNCDELRVLLRAQATPEGARQKEDSQPNVGAHKTDQDGLSSIRAGVIRAISIVAIYLTINGLALNGVASRAGEPATAEQWGSLIGESLILGAITFTIATVFHWSLGRAAFFRPRRGWIAWLVVAGAFSGWNGAADGGALYAATLATLTAVFGAIIWAAIFILLGMFWRGLTRLMAPRSQDYESPSTPGPEATTSSSSRTNRANALYFVTLYGSLAVGVSVIAFGTLTSFEFFSDTNTVSDDELTSQQLIPITIVTEPSDAVVEFPNRRVVYVPGMELPEGSYYVRVSAPGYEPRTQFLVHSARPQEHVIVLEPLRQAFTVEAIPSGARVRVLNIVPIYEPGIMLSAGSYRVEVSASGYETVTETVWHDIAEPTIHQVELPRIGTQFPPIVATAEPNMLQSFTIEVEPLDSRVQLMGTSTEYEPGMMLSAGNYRVEVSAPGHETVIETVPHNAASPTVHRVELSFSVAQMPENGRGTGTLEPGDYELDSGAYSDLWTVQAQAGQTLIVDLTSPDFDALLMLIDTRNSELVAEDDDSGVETDARIRLDLTEDGEYLIVASS